MSARTGLAGHEVAVLEALGDAGRFVRSHDVLVSAARRSGIGPRYAYPVLVDLAVPWRRHLPLLEGEGNFGTQGDDPPADAVYTQVRLSPAGRLALAAERGEVGPVPLGLVEGSHFADGEVPPFAPAAVLAALRSGSGDAGPPVLPTGGLVEGDVDGLLAGRPTTMRLVCRTVRETDARGRQQLVITEVPLGVSTDAVCRAVADRVDAEVRHPDDGRRYADYLPEPTGPPEPDDRPVFHPLVRDLRDEISTRTGTRIVVVLARDADPVDALTWLRGVEPFAVEVDWCLPAPQRERLLGWDAGDGSGLDALEALLQ